MILTNEWKSIKALEFDKVRRMLSEHCPTDGSRELALSLLPLDDEREITLRLRRVTDAKEMMITRGMPPTGQIKDVSAILERANKGASLGLRDLLDTANVLRTARSLRDYPGDLSLIDTTLNELFERLMPERRLEDRIYRTVISEDVIADDASPALADIRRKIRQANNAVRDMLQKYTSGSYSQYLQENIVTQRGGRWVIPVKAEHRSDVPGLVHDTSASGATLFIEPMALVEQNNKIRELQVAEGREIERILFELSSLVSAASKQISLNYDNITLLAFIFGCAQFSYDIDATEPVLGSRREVSLKRARHPLLDRKKTVPVTIGVGGDYRMLVITGPNTGGKTVSLKTLGLFSLMAQAGLHIPCESGSVVCVFDEIYCDVGDEQSIEQSLSTFSSHMVSIVEILEKMTPDSLVLIDELGAGTDPVEGAALAVAILERVLASGALCAATTHYAELKAFAIDTPEVSNASCEFDIKTLRPTYKLVIGAPGKSMAFAISEHLGLSSEVIERAKAHVDPETRSFERVIEKLDSSRFELDSELENARRIRKELEERKQRAERELEERDGQSRREAEDMLRKARTTLEGARASVEYIFRELDEIKKSKDQKNFASKYQSVKQDVRKRLSELDDEVNPVLTEDDGDYELPRELRAGDAVIHRTLGTEGTVVSVDSKGNATVQMGAVKSRIPVDKLRLADKQPKKKKYPVGSFHSSLSRDFKATLDVRGLTGDDAWFMVDKYLDDAKIASVNSVTILHGKGTGALRKALWNCLKSDSRVKSFRAGQYGEGDYGVTVVEMK